MQKADAYNVAMRKAKNEDNQASSSEIPPDPTVDAWFYDCNTKCVGCCGHDEHNPENNSTWCTIL